MNTKKIKEHNPKEFLDDLKTVREVMVFARVSGTFLTVTKKELLQEAERKKMEYYITDTIFVRKRNVMVII